MSKVQSPVLNFDDSCTRKCDGGTEGTRIPPRLDQGPVAHNFVSFASAVMSLLLLFLQNAILGCSLVISPLCFLQVLTRQSMLQRLDQLTCAPGPVLPPSDHREVKSR